MIPAISKRVTPGTPVVLHVRVVRGAGGGPDKTILSAPRFLAGSGYRVLCLPARARRPGVRAAAGQGPVVAGPAPAGPRPRSPRLAGPPSAARHLPEGAGDHLARA